MSQHGYSPPSKMEPSGSGSQQNETITLLIETLTGNSFEMTVSPADTIATLKSKIHRVEGIAVSAQHLLFNLNELDDDSKISDHLMSNGSVLRLVTSMRGGPISTRRVSPTPEERAWMDLVDSNRCDDILQRIPSGQLTVLVFCEGEQLNLFRVVENNDGTYSPITDPVNTSSIRNALAADEPDTAAQRLHENTVTMGKMKELQRKLTSGVFRRKMRGDISQELISHEATQESHANSSHIDSIRQSSNWGKAQPTLQVASLSDGQLPGQPAEQRPIVRIIRSKKSVPCPHRKLTLPRLESTQSTQMKSHHPPQTVHAGSSRTFLPALSVPRRGKQELPRQLPSSQPQSQSLRIPAPPRLIAPPLHVPPLLQCPPPLRPVWNQRQGPIPVVVPEMKPCSATMPKMHPVIKDDSLQYMPPQPTVSRVPTMCQNRRRLDPILPQRELISNLRLRMQQPQLHPQSSTQSDSQSGAILHPATAAGLPKRNSVLNISNCAFVPNNLIVPQPAPPLQNACQLVLLRGPTSSPKERFTEYLTAYLAQSFSSRFSGLTPKDLPLRLSHQLTKHLSHHFVRGLSDVAANRLSLQLSNRISQFMEECLSNRCPKDVLGQALRSILEERVWDPHMRVAVRGLPTFNAEVGSNFVHTPEPVRDNIRETRELYSQIPRFHSAPTPLTSQGASVRHSVFSGLQREPLYVRLNDSAMYQRGMVPVLLRPATSQNYPPPVFCNSIQAGQPSTELLRRVIESSVPQLRQPRLQTEIQRDQSQVQVINGVGRMTLPFRSPPPFLEPFQQPVYAGCQPQGIRWRTVKYLVHPNSQQRLQTEPTQIEPQTGNNNANGENQQGPNTVDVEVKLPKKQRCCQCRKKLTISNNYLCRCQKLFCSTHRYSEAHNCNYDYKEEGRKLLLQENPQVKAEKIVKM
ncbi:AN1-type zinc finger protein 4 [Frankliniella fusca]|uniref:AN1-type zinc finger protein 4 n=1 Tax=Frankliniella fusca TaxID=407009 RepID=A0AAE1L9W4_9NEOP|nr:AN1-type zinc finger protein 4 [Frankliniella fusca]